MKFLLDENFPRAGGEYLENLGFEVLYARSECGQGAPDSDLMAFAVQSESVVLTTDRDFFHTLAISHPHHSGVIAIALRQPSRSLIVARLGWFLDNISLDLLPGRAFQLRDQTWVCHPSIEN